MHNSYSDHTKLTEAKQMRKRADEDARLLANRISLLRQEEQKAQKKIEETRHKAEQILNLRNRNSELLRQKDEENKRKQSEYQQKLEEIKKLKNFHRLTSQQRASSRQRRAMSEANSMKASHKQNLQQISMNRGEDLNQRVVLRNFIKNQMREAEEKKRRLERERIEKARNDTLKKIEEENKLRRIREEEIARMEQEELLLIQKLQNTQLLQKSAYDELENALAGPLGMNPGFN